MQRKNPGFTIIEMVVGIAVFTILISGTLAAFLSLSHTVKIAREKTIVAGLISTYSEIVKKMPYSEVGTINGNPHGTLADKTNPVQTTIEGKLFRIFYEVVYIDDPADGTAENGQDANPSDYKQVKITIENDANPKSTTVYTTLAPSGLESMMDSGTLRISVIDANGLPVKNAQVTIKNNSLTPNILLQRTTNSAGKVSEVGLPPSSSYDIQVSKQGYSQDGTLPISPTILNPTKPLATVIVGQTTPVSLSIDKISNLTLKTLDRFCQPIANTNIHVVGEKLVGTSPNAYKYSEGFQTSPSGLVDLLGIEWDTYTPSLINNASLQVYGTSPVQRITVFPDTSQQFSLILGPKSNHSLLVIVKDATTGAPIQGALTLLEKTGSSAYSKYAYTGGSVWSQKSWSGGSGQYDYTTNYRYWQDDGGTDTNSIPAGVRLKRYETTYVSHGTIESSTFDTGAESTQYTSFSWQPTSQENQTSVKFQIATNNDNSTWDFTGPDGTAGTFYSTSNSAISHTHNNKRYVRYKMFLDTTDTQKTPVITSVELNYVSGCFSPGQSIFTDLTQGNEHRLTISSPTYQTQTLENLNISGNQIMEILLSH